MRSIGAHLTLLLYVLAGLATQLLVKCLIRSVGITLVLVASLVAGVSHCDVLAVINLEGKKKKRVFSNIRRHRPH